MRTEDGGPKTDRGRPSCRFLPAEITEDLERFQPLQLVTFVIPALDRASSTPTGKPRGYSETSFLLVVSHATAPDMNLIEDGWNDWNFWNVWNFYLKAPSCLPAGGDDALPVRMRKQI